MRKLSFKKRMIRLFPVIIILMLASAPGITFAAGLVEFTGPNSANQWELSTEDLFGEKTKDLAPGIETSVDIELLNSSTVPATFYLAAKPENTEETKMLQDAVDMAVSYKIKGDNTAGREIYRGKLSGRDNTVLYSENGASLGVLGPKQTGIITVAINIPSSLGNEYMEKICSINWKFIAVEFIQANNSDSVVDMGEAPSDINVPLEDGSILISSPEGDNSSGDAKNKAPVISVGDADSAAVTLVSLGSGIPQTGGIKTYVLPLVIILIVLAGLFAFTFYKRKSKAGRKAAE
jgi:LPXTG-motif cell wall-anchored protein